MVMSLSKQQRDSEGQGSLVLQFMRSAPRGAGGRKPETLAAPRAGRTLRPGDDSARAPGRGRWVLASGNLGIGVSAEWRASWPVDRGSRRIGGPVDRAAGESVGWRGPGVGVRGSVGKSAGQGLGELRARWAGGPGSVQRVPQQMGPGVGPGAGGGIALWRGGR